MSVIKIIFSLTTTTVLQEYENAKGSNLWEDLYARMAQALPNASLRRENIGNFQYTFFVETDKGEAACRTAAEGVLDELLPNAEERRLISMTIKSADAPPTSADERLAGFLRALHGGKAPAQAPSEDEPTAPPADAVPKAPEVPAEQEEPASPATAEPQTLAERVQRIKALKEGLLSRIHGQRHAVDEVVQSIFEAELFAANNPKRKGPLATFLFTGPSGVGKTYLAELCSELLARPMLIVDMSEYSDNLANNKFNGEHGQPAVVTGFVRKHPNGILIFDEVEKAHINTIHLFLQILDAARMMDHKAKKEVSFRDNIVILTTNAGASLYDDATVCDLSGVPRSVILDALRTDINPQTNEPFFPSCITTRMANGQVILFNHLEPFSLMRIVQDEIAQQVALFEHSSGIKVEYDERQLAAMVMYSGGGVSDARTLRGLARNILVRELQEVVMQLYSRGADAVEALTHITLQVDTHAYDDGSIGNLFVSHDRMQVAVFADGVSDLATEADRHNATFECFTDGDLFKRRIRGVTDYVLIDPLCGLRVGDRVPNDIEDLDADGVRMFDYVREFLPEIPVYILDKGDETVRSFDTLLARGAKGVIRQDGCSIEQLLADLSFNALINNGVYSLGRSGKFLAFNCAQYLEGEHASVLFEKLQLKSAPRAADSAYIAKKDNTPITFADVIGCKTAKETLAEFCKALDNPRDIALSGRRMPKGVLLYGPPGTGKTMLAKAMANECGATFIPTSATAFFGSLVGETERNIRDLFKRARKYAPSIIFIDEVDAIGRMRTGGVGSVHNEDALNTFLAEMDGFVVDEKRPVFILAATNYDLDGDSGRVLDPAFVRRFDSKVFIPLPDTDDRYALLCNSLKKHGIHFGENHEKILRNMAERTGGMNNADLEMLNAQFVRALGDREPDGALYLDTLDAYRFGEVNKLDPDHLRQTACHEAGHALVCRLCGTTPSFLTVVSRGHFGGYMESAGESKKGTFTYDELMNMVCRCLAGRVAEIEMYGPSLGNNTGASSDLQKARYYVRASLNDFAMGDKLYARGKQEEAEALMQQQYARTQTMLREHRDALEKLTDLLAEKKSLNRATLEAFFAQVNM